MQRRNFIKNSFVAATGLLVIPTVTKAAWYNENVVTLDELEKAFIHPPNSARPWCFWMWMNGNITKEGITADLEAMHRMGIGGVINFNSAVGIPRGPVKYASDEWMNATAHAVKEAVRLGIDYSMHNSPGYSGCGGPWITPEMSMQQLVWTELFTSSNGNISAHLEKPYAKHDFYKDAMVVAYPSLPDEKILMKDSLQKLTVNGVEVDKSILTTKNFDTRIRFERPANQKIDSGTDAFDDDSNNGTAIGNSSPSIKEKIDNALVLEFDKPFTARAISIYRKPEIPRDLFDGPRDHPPLFQLSASDDGVHYKFVCTIHAPELRSMDTPAAASFEVVTARFFQLAANGPSWITQLELHSGPRLAGWPGKTNHTHGDSNGENPAIEASMIIHPDNVIDITSFMDEDGHLNWNAPIGNWTILRIGHTSTGEEPAAHPDAGKGLEIDKFRKAALDLHFSSFLDPFLNRVKPFIGKSFKAITIDSYEAGKQNWTVNFPAEFKQRKQYDLLQWMPVMTGRIVGSIEQTEKVLWDVRKTQADLLAENFYAYYQALLKQRNLELFAEPYGDGTMDSLQIAQHLDITMSEFWTRYIYGSDTTSKQAASAAHVYGKSIVAAEAFTAMPATAKWTDYPFSLKAEGDYFFSLGVNRITFHTFVHQPYFTGKPGMTMGPFGMHIDRNNTWTEQAYGYMQYLQRTQYMLQQGFAVIDICYFKGDNPESGIPDVYKQLPQGFKVDVVGADALHSRFRIKDNLIQLSDGMQYGFCVLAPVDQIMLSTLERLQRLVNNGMTLVVSSKPSKAYGHEHSDSEIEDAINEFYGDLNTDAVKERRYGKGKIIWNDELDAVPASLQLSPDFIYTSENPGAAIHFFHKRIGEDEFYLVTNHKRRPEKLVGSFRVVGKQPVFWNAENGDIYTAPLFETVGRRTQIPMELSPAGSLIVVFRGNAAQQGFTALLKDAKPIITTKLFDQHEVSPYAAVINNFTISLWAKPDTFSRSGRSFLFHAPEGSRLYGKGHAAMAISAGQNGVKVYERSYGNAKEVLNYNGSIEGWTHIVVVYRDGKPAIFINGKHAAEEHAFAAMVHPGMNAPADESQFTTYFEGNATAPILFTESLSPERIMVLFKEGLPAPPLPGAVSWMGNNRKQPAALFFKNGTYRLQSSNNTKQPGLVQECSARDITGSWQLSFPAGSGAPATLVLPQLMSLRLHDDFNVKHFSGTASYFKDLYIAKQELQPGKRILLHLGRVEVIAELIVNKTKAGILWKEPFMIDLTSFVKTGINKIEIKLTTLWPNRLIGDEHLPVEDEFSKDNFIKSLPAWYVNNQPKPGQRKSFAVWHTYDKSDPLLESGLLGPVRLLVAIEKEV